MRKLIFSRWTRIASIGVFFIATSAFYKSCGNTYSEHTPIPEGQVLKYRREHPDQEIRLEYIPRTVKQPTVYVNDFGAPSTDLEALLRGSSNDIDAAFGGRFSFPKVKGKDAKKYKGLANGTIVRGYAAASGGSSLRVTATALVRFTSAAAGTACMAFSFKAGDNGQEAYGTFKFLGGTGQGARLSGKGSFNAVDPTGSSPGYSAELGLDPTVAKARSVPSTCGKPPKVKVPTGNKVTASFTGFAVSKSAPPASATLTPSGGTITGCQTGGNLYGVLQYAGPSATEAEGSSFGGSTEASFSQKLKQGRNVIDLAKNPSNGSYEVKTEIASTKGATLTGTTILLPTFSISCS